MWHLLILMLISLNLLQIFFQHHLGSRVPISWKGTVAEQIVGLLMTYRISRAGSGKRGVALKESHVPSYTDTMGEYN